MIFLVRHASAEPAGEGGDAARPLTPSGREDAVRVGRGLKALDVSIGAILSSPLARARETAGLIARELGVPRVEIRPELSSGAHPRAILEAALPLAGPGVVVVAHNPELALLTGAAMSPGAVCGLEVDGEGRARLLWHRSPGEWTV